MTCYLIEYLSFIRNSTGQDHIECGDAVGYDHDQILSGDVVHIAHFAFGAALLAWEGETGFCECL